MFSESFAAGAGILRGFFHPPLILCDTIYLGVDKSRWASRSSKPVAGRFAGRGGFDSHPFPPIEAFIKSSGGENEWNTSTAMTQHGLML